MSKPSRRPRREQRKLVPTKERRRAQAKLAEQRAKLGYTKRPHTSIANHKCTYDTVEEEQVARNQATAEHIETIRTQLPFLLKRIANIKGDSQQSTYPAGIRSPFDKLRANGFRFNYRLIFRSW